MVSRYRQPIPMTANAVLVPGRYTAQAVPSPVPTKRQNSDTTSLAA